jgi:hypothetical protein
LLLRRHHGLFYDRCLMRVQRHHGHRWRLPTCSSRLLALLLLMPRGLWARSPRRRR